MCCSNRKKTFIEMIKVHHEGVGILISFFLVFVVASVTAFFYAHWMIFWIVLLSSVVLMGLALNFFRSPHRSNALVNEPGVIVAPADGKLVVVEETYESEFFHERRLKVSIFMSIFDVHANWFCCNGLVKHVSHTEGNFLKAFLPKSSVENERSAVIIETPEGYKVLERQIAGAVARRIVTYPEVGDVATINDFIGFIKFGSRIDLYLPIGTEICLTPGIKVKGNTTILGKLPV